MSHWARNKSRPTGPERSGPIHDLRHLTWFSIDNDDTRDLDQLSVAEPLAAGTTRLRVAVADVDAMVRPGGAVDGHAGVSTTSVYTAAGVFPMLPEVLSTDLTSLHEGQERLAVVALRKWRLRPTLMVTTDLQWRRYPVPIFSCILDLVLSGFLLNRSMA